MTGHENADRLRRAEAALRENEEKYSALFDASTDAIFLETLEGRILDCNMAACKLYGYERAEMLTLSAGALVPEIGDATTLPFTTNQFTSGRGVFVEGRGKRKDGTVFPTEVSAALVTVGDEHLVLAYIRDITARKRAEATLRDSEAKYRNLFERASDSILIIDPETHRVLEANENAARRLGYSRDELLRLTLDDIESPADPSYHHTLIVHESQSSGSIVFEYTYRHKDGTEIPVEISSRVVEYGGQRAIQNFVRDISERKRNEEHRLALAVERERVRVLAGFIQDVSHEFRTPLSIINAGLYLLGRSLKQEKHVAQLRSLEEQVNYLSDLVDAMLTMSRLDSEPAFRFALLDLNGLLREVETHLRPLAEEKGLTLTLTLSDTLPTIQGDGQELHRALTNLIENALLYTPPGGAVTVRTLREGQSVRVEVEDTGIGIRAGELPHIFERFYRGDEARTTRGAGLGLPIARRIVELHHGLIDVESVSGRGSTFRVTLPLPAV